MNADAIICISNATKKTLTDIYKVDDKKISVIHLGISENFTSDTISNIKLNDISDKPYFLFVGFRKLYKNFIFFIEAFSKWNKNKNYNILIAGGGELTEEEHLSLKKFGVEKQVKLLGFVEGKDLRYMYKNSIAFVYPSLEEGFGLPILEAIGSRGEVIASDIDAFREIGEDMIRYFNPRKIESLVNALEQSTLERQTDEELEKRAKYVTNKYSWKECVNKTIEVYKKVQKDKK
jgi:glycosyltransferase involved in cell wall biosynthesis